MDQQHLQQLVDGAARRMNTNNRLEFEVGNWRGTRLEKDLRFFDKVYNKKYDPDAIKFINSQISTMKHNKRFNSVAYDNLGQKGGECNQRYYKEVRKQLKSLDRHVDPFYAGTKAKRG